jgi:hypothetical protein
MIKLHFYNHPLPSGDSFPAASAVMVVARLGFATSQPLANSQVFAPVALDFGLAMGADEID